MTNILVTGGAGFIGSHLCESLISLGHKVICVDNFNDYYNPESKRKNISLMQDNPLFVLYEVDTRDKEKLVEIFVKENIQKVIHLAAMAGVRNSIEHPLIYFDVNISGTSNLLELSVKHNVLKFVFGSSSSVYGGSTQLPFIETQELLPLNPYATTKKMGEDLCKFFSDYNDLSVVCLRFFTVYGPRGRPDMAVYSFVKAIYEEKEISVFGEGLLSRDFTYVLDTVSGIVASLDLDRKFEIINLGKGSKDTVNKLLEAMETCIGKKAIIKLMPKNEGEAEHTLAGINKAKELLNFNPQIGISEGINKFVEWYNQSK